MLLSSAFSHEIPGFVGFIWRELLLAGRWLMNRLLVLFKCVKLWSWDLLLIKGYSDSRFESPLLKKLRSIVLDALPLHFLPHFPKPKADQARLL